MLDGGANGYLDMLVSTAKYDTIAPGTLFVPPTMPGNHPPNGHTISNCDRKNAIQNSSTGTPNLYSQLQVITGTAISYDGYVSLVYGAAQSYDTKFSTRINLKGKNRTVYQNEQLQMNTMKNMNIMLTQT